MLLLLDLSAAFTYSSNWKTNIGISGLVLSWLNLHCYVDDTPLYMPIKTDDSSQIMKLEVCSSAVKSWLSQNFLLLNSDKIQIEMLVTSLARYRNLFDRVTIIFDSCVTAENLSVTFDPALSFNWHIPKIPLFHLHNTVKILSLFPWQEQQS